MSLETLNENEPAGFHSVDRGAGEIRLTRKDSRDSVQIQHWLSGEHRFPPASVAGPAIGQIALDDTLLRYGNGSSWVTGTFPAEGKTGGLGVILSTTTYVNIIQFTLTQPYIDYSAWLSGGVKFKRPTTDITSAAMDFQIHALVPPDNGFTITGAQFETFVQTTGKKETEWVPCIHGFWWNSMDNSVSLPAGTVITLQARKTTSPAQPADMTVELMIDSNVVLIGA